MTRNGTYVLRGAQGDNIAKTQEFNIDNGAGTTIDDVLMANLPWDIQILSIEEVYTEATDTAGAASANVKVGTAAAGEEIVASTALSVAKAVGDAVALTLVTDVVLAGSTIFVRHTGVATTEGGKYYVQMRYRIIKE